ncbi:TIGR03758 family integrating conjugative element protein [Carnimonas bestiolae]|uniref:TIGR03758 family integrating conjugative element protein n=1 Tax=Carnimonas bestiolae TaxID=3402172 RepID=UPI003EDCB06F
MAGETVSQAFENGAGYSGNAVYFVMAGLGYTAILLTAAWVLVSAYQGMAGNNLNGRQFTWICIRGVFLILIIGWIVLPK